MQTEQQMLPRQLAASPLQMISKTTLTILMLSATIASAGELSIDLGLPVGAVSPIHHGLMTEEINHSYDGGLYAELLRNRAFLDNPSTPEGWTLEAPAKGAASITIDDTQPLNEVIPVSLRLEVTKLPDRKALGFANEGYWGVPVHPNTSYRASFHAKAPGYAGKVTISIESEDGKTVYASAHTGRLSGEWQEYSVVLQTKPNTPSTKARCVVRVNKPGTVWFSMVSLFPPTWKDRPNGLRKDLMQLMADLKPKFLRFPGGNYLEGNKIAERFPWKSTLGPISQRPGHPCNWGYRSSDGMGLLEFLLWAEDLGAEPVLGIYAGYSLSGERVAPGKDLEPFVQEALEEIEYVIGDADTTQWGARRARDGHPDPFKLRYVEIGNEDGFDAMNTYDARFAQFYDAIKKQYPELQIISSVGHHDPDAKRVLSRKPDLCDEHYYNSLEGFLAMSPGHYDKRDRSEPLVFVGEWATYDTDFPPWDQRSHQEPPTPSFKSAVGDAAFMTTMERNSELVRMQCYAPLFVNVNPGARQWRPNLIGYDCLHAFGSPSYHAIKMFSTHLGDQILRMTRSDTQVLASVTREQKTGTVYLKLVNPKPTPENLTISFTGQSAPANKVTALVLASEDLSATNSIDAPSAVVPLESVLDSEGSKCSYEIPANAIVVLTFRPTK